MFVENLFNKRYFESVDPLFTGPIIGSLAAKYGIRNIPTILFFKNGEVADKQVGAVPKSTIVGKLDALL